jgi:hypothetical protein
MNRITKYIESIAYAHDIRWNTIPEKRENLRELTSVIFTEVFNICWKYTDNETLFLIMRDIDKIKEENQLPI